MSVELCGTAARGGRVVTEPGKTANILTSAKTGSVLAVLTPALPLDADSHPNICLHSSVNSHLAAFLCVILAYELNKTSVYGTLF